LSKSNFTFTLPKLYPSQQAFIDDPAHYKVGCMGRRWGKSLAGGEWLTLGALVERLPCWWVAPTFTNTREAWRTLTSFARQLNKHPDPKMHPHIIKEEFLIEYPGGGYVQIWSADKPDNIRGGGCGRLLADEFAKIKEDVFTDILLPAMGDYDAKAIFISTPRGLNHFYRMHQLGLAGEDRFKSFHGTSMDNPHVPASFWENARRLMSAQAFAQEIMAEFVNDALSVFRNIDACIDHAPPTEPQAGHNYAFGVDWGQAKDYTAISVWDVDEVQEVYIDRFNQIGWAIQRDRLRALFDKWQPNTIVAEENSAGTVNIEELQREGLPVYGLRMTNPEKERLVRGFGLALEKGDLRLSPDKNANEELRAYGQEFLERSQLVRYGAPRGGFDDTVIARMLAYDAIGSRMGEPLILDWM
jgi:phage terminase large subunit-like protein